MQFISPVIVSIPSDIILDADESFHALKVLRFKKGDEINLFDGRFRYKGFIKDIVEGKVVVYVSKRIKNNIKKHRVNLYMPLIDRKDFEEVIRCCTEIGVDSFYPLITRYTQTNNISRLDSKRFERIIVSAVKQSEASSFSKVEKVVKFDELISSGKKVICGFIDVQKKIPFKKAIEEMGDEINIMVGPEGGFSDDEKKMINEKFFTVKLSDNILTSKTAAISLACLVMYHINNEDIF